MPLGADADGNGYGTNEKNLIVSNCFSTDFSSASLYSGCFRGGSASWRLEIQEWNRTSCFYGTCKLQHYRRRSPEASPLYQIVYHSRDDLQFQWGARFQHQYGCLRDEVLKTFDEYLNCGILAHGAARVYCDGCKHSLLIAFSCKRRGVCPSCGAKRAVKFAEHIYSAVIEDVPHRHTVFTIPKRLRVFFKYDRKLNTILFRAAWGAPFTGAGQLAKRLICQGTVATPVGDEANALSSPLPQLKKPRVTIEESSVRAVGPRA